MSSRDVDVDIDHKLATLIIVLIMTVAVLVVLLRSLFSGVILDHATYKKFSAVDLRESLRLAPSDKPGLTSNQFESAVARKQKRASMLLMFAAFAFIGGIL